MRLLDIGAAWARPAESFGRSATNLKNDTNARGLGVRSQAREARGMLARTPPDQTPVRVVLEVRG
jgi:hypothetical protein